MPRRSFLATCLALACTAGPAAALAQAAPHAHAARQHGRHVLLISVDGLHASDLARYTADHPTSALAGLSDRGTTYSNALSSFPSDSFPGLLALVTGGTPKSTGVYYDDSYDRSLYKPGSNCTGTPGTEVDYSEAIDRNPNALDAGGGIDPAKLPQAKQGAHCVPVYPHSFLRVNTIFNVARKAGLRTAWSDKHPSYDLVNGPSGHGVTDLYTPEIAANKTTGSVTATEAYDALKVRAILNQIGGRNSTGSRSAPTPAIFGMNFQTVSVAQKLPFNGSPDIGGYEPGGEDFTAQLDGALSNVDAQIAKMVAGLDRRGLLDSTQIIITAKHGQAPKDPTQHVRISGDTIPGIVTTAGAPPAQATQDDVALLWLADQSTTGQASAALSADQQGADTAHIHRVIDGPELNTLFGDPLRDPRVPDVVVQPEQGVVYSSSTKKVAEHGGGAPDDRQVALLVADGRVRGGPGGVYDPASDGSGGRTVDQPVSTTQVAPSILRYLRLRPADLQAVGTEGTRPLPGSGAR